MPNDAHPSTVGINQQRLFIGSCLALVATSVAFATVGAIMLALKREFVLTNEEVGWIGGAALWGFAITQLIFSPLCDSLGMRLLLRLAFLAHLLGALIMMVSTGFWMLFSGALVIAMGNGLVEAACNPLVAALYPDNKTIKLNQFHVWFPGGIVLGGLAAYGLDAIGITSWQIKLALILIPTTLYGVMLLTQKFPATEGVQSGVSMGEMFKATFTTPLMLLMLLCMAMTASIELGPNRWVPAVLEAGGIAGILVLVWINGLMAAMRYKAGALVHRLSPTGILLASALVSGIGLFWLSYAESGVMAFASATVFALGVCYFWPTMLGFVSERIPKSGALGLGLMGAMGMAVVGLATAPIMGRIADQYVHQQLPEARTVSVFQGVEAMFPAAMAMMPEEQRGDVSKAIEASDAVLQHYTQNQELPPNQTANALRTVIDSGVASEVVGEASSILGPADNYGGRISFRYVVPLSGILVLIFGLLYLNDRRAGGYKVERLGADSSKPAGM